MAVVDDKLAVVMLVVVKCCSSPDVLDLAEVTRVGGFLQLEI